MGEEEEAEAEAKGLGSWLLLLLHVMAKAAKWTSLSCLCLGCCRSVAAGQRLRALRVYGP